jgi:hypothetical protein
MGNPYSCVGSSSRKSTQRSSEMLRYDVTVRRIVRRVSRVEMVGTVRLNAEDGEEVRAKVRALFASGAIENWAAAVKKPPTFQDDDEMVLDEADIGLEITNVRIVSTRRTPPLDDESRAHMIRAICESSRRLGAMPFVVELLELGLGQVSDHILYDRYHKLFPEDAKTTDQDPKGPA